MKGGKTGMMMKKLGRNLAKVKNQMRSVRNVKQDNGKTKKNG